MHAEKEKAEREAAVMKGSRELICERGCETAAETKDAYGGAEQSQRCQRLGDRASTYRLAEKKPESDRLGDRVAI